MEQHEQRWNASDLDRLLWAGFAPDAIGKLEAIKSRDAEPEARASAAWALARWYASIGDYTAALNELSDAKGLIAEVDWDRAHLLLEISILAELGRASEAEEALQSALRKFGEQPEICLFAARVAGIGAEFDTHARDRIEIDRLRLGWINKPFIAAGLASLELANPQRPLSFDNLATSPVTDHPKADAAKLSVIMPAYNASETLPVALRSVLVQSWDNLEVLIVDDASTDDTWSIIQSFATADHRVKALRHDQNRGTYAARNTGLGHASGNFVTVHDADDWSHADKFAVQATDLLERGKPFNTTMSARIFRDLTVRLKVINSAVLHNNVGSLMARRSDLIAIGGWDEARTGADDELYFRLLAIHSLEQKPLHSTAPLTFTLIRADSLSASKATGIATIKYGAQRQYKEAYRYWHAVEMTKAKPDLVMRQGVRPFPIPAICKTELADPLRCDVLYVSDFSQPDGSAVFNARMIEAGHKCGLKQAWFQWPSFDPANRPVDMLVRERLNANMADCIVAGEAVDCSVVILYHPAILKHAPDPLPKVRAGACLLIADQAPFRVNQCNPYHFGQAVQAAQHAFGVEPIIAPVLPSIRHNIRAGAKYARFTKHNCLTPLDVTAWKRDAIPRDDSRSPVLGGYTLHYSKSALLRQKTLRAAYCADKTCEMRFLDEARNLKAESDHDIPANWIFLSGGEIEPRDFLCTLDICVCFPHRKASGVLDRAPIEAMAVGVPVILPPRFREIYDDAAVYAESGDVFNAISELWRSKADYEAQIGRGLRFVEANCSYESFVECLRPYLDAPVKSGVFSKFLALLRSPSR